MVYWADQNWCGSLVTVSAATYGVDMSTLMSVDSNKCLISNLPFETRIALTIEAYDKLIKNDKYFNLGSCQIPLYRSDGQIQSGHLKINIWPNITNHF